MNQLATTRTTDRDDSARSKLAAAISASALPKYVYGYPTKRAFRVMVPPRTIASVWSGAEGALNLYVHVPFCSYRCSFCTLFLTTSQGPDLIQRYVDSLCRQIEMYGSLIGHMEVMSLNFGGGTPTLLSPEQFSQVFEALHTAFPRWVSDAEIGIEGSPDSMREPVLERVRSLGVNRVSMGLQSLDPAEQTRAGRRYAPRVVYEAVDAINAQGFENVNYDLIYGLEGQTHESWFRSLEQTLGFGPQTVTLYPVVVRPLTALSKSIVLRAGQFMHNQDKYAIYDESVQRLAEQGFRQNSFVRFSRCEADGLRQEVADFAGVPLLGLGAGSRSYTRDFHYGSAFAVGRRETLDIIQAFVEHSHDPQGPVGIGMELSDDEQRRRFCILNLSLGKIDATSYRERFGANPDAHFGEELDALVDLGCCEREAEGWALTPKGFKYSNVIGDLFQSNAVSELERAYVPS